MFKENSNSLCMLTPLICCFHNLKLHSSLVVDRPQLPLSSQSLYHCKWYPSSHLGRSPNAQKCSCSWKYCHGQAAVPLDFVLCKEMDRIKYLIINVICTCVNVVKSLCLYFSILESSFRSSIQNFFGLTLH